MLITYLRSSSINEFSWCQQKYFINYVLGYPQKSTKSNTCGTILHKVMEVLALQKKAIQDGENSVFDEDLEQQFSVDISDLKKIIDAVFDYYDKANPHLELGEKEYKDCVRWIKKGLEYRDGQLHPHNLEIVDVEKRFDHVIDKDWAKYEFDYEGEKLEGQLAIKGTVDLVVKHDEETLEVIDYKGLTLDTPIPTIDGWVTMKEIKVGDIIFDENGKKTKVIGKSDKKRKPCYKITFDDTSEVICDKEHLWKLNDNSVVNTLQLNINDKIWLAKPLEINKRQLPIDPYVLGIWLGDGRARHGEITSGDSFVFKEIKRRGYKIGKDYNRKNPKKAKSRTIYGLVTKLKSLNLKHNKHIPNIYLRASYSQRLDLLRGLMDSDGYANNTRKQGVFSNCNKKLSDGVKELLLSLGQRPYQVKVKTWCANGSRLIVDAYMIFFRPININPFLLPRKSNIIKEDWGAGRSDKRRIKNIEYIGYKTTQCIKVDSSSHTYLCSYNMIPTHNSGQRKNWETGEKKTLEEFQRDPQLLLYNYALRKSYPNMKYVIMTIFYVRDGGPFSPCMGEREEKMAEDIIRETFEKIKKTEVPDLLSYDQSHWKCRRLCDYAKNKWPGTNQSMCSFIHNELKNFGQDYVLHFYKKEGHDLSHYKSPGSTDE